MRPDHCRREGWTAIGPWSNAVAGHASLHATVGKLSLKDVPVDGFWSVSLYDATGYYEKNDYNAYSLNNITAAKAADVPSPSSSAAATARSPTAC